MKVVFDKSRDHYFVDWICHSNKYIFLNLVLFSTGTLWENCPPRWLMRIGMFHTIKLTIRYDPLELIVNARIVTVQNFKYKF